MLNINFADDWIRTTNHEPVVLKATVQQTEPQPPLRLYHLVTPTWRFIFAFESKWFCLSFDFRVFKSSRTTKKTDNSCNGNS